MEDQLTNYDDFRQTEAYKRLPAGRLFPADEKCLMYYSRGKRIAVDIGTLLGRSAKILSYNAKHVFTFDIFEDFRSIDDETNRIKYMELFIAVPHYYADIKMRLSSTKNITVIQGKSDQLSLITPEIDIAFIDSDHSADGVKYDYENVISRMVSGGIIAFHDYYRLEDEPYIKVYEFIETLYHDNRVKFIEHTGSAGRLTVWQKL